MENLTSIFQEIVHIFRSCQWIVHYAWVCVLLILSTSPLSLSAILVVIEISWSFMTKLSMTNKSNEKKKQSCIANHIWNISISLRMKNIIETLFAIESKRNTFVWWVHFSSTGTSMLYRVSRSHAHVQNIISTVFRTDTQNCCRCMHL